MNVIDYDAMSEAEKIEAVAEEGYSIQFIETPSEAVCMAAVSQNGSAIRHIKNPSDEVQLAAVQEWAAAIRYIKNSSEVINLTAVQRDGITIKFIKNPSEAVCMAAVEQNGYAIEFIDNPSVALQIMAVNQNGHAIQYIKTPSEEIQVAAVKQNPAVAFYSSLPMPLCDAVVTAIFLYHPRYSEIPRDILNRAPEILEAHCMGLSDVYMIGLSIGMSGDELSKTMIEWIESHAVVAANVTCSHFRPDTSKQTVDAFGAPIDPFADPGINAEDYAHYSVSAEMAP